jgi:hypothetical protein
MKGSAFRNPETLNRFFILKFAGIAQSPKVEIKVGEYVITSDLIGFFGIVILQNLTRRGERKIYLTMLMIMALKLVNIYQPCGRVAPRLPAIFKYTCSPDHKVTG